MLWRRIHALIERGTLSAGRLTVDRREHVAKLDGKPLDLSPLLFHLLACLVERPGSLVTRAELKSALWPYAARIDTERRLNTAVRAVRVALGDDGDTPSFIETVRGRGYRWIGAKRRFPMKAFASALAVMLTTVSILSWDRPAERPSGGIALVEAQAAVDAWRQQPTNANLASAAASVDSVATGGAEIPALHLLQGQLALEGRWDWVAAERHYRRALALDRDNADAQLGLAWLEVNRGRTDRALAHVELLMTSTALTEERRANLGWLLIRLDRPALAAAMCDASADDSINLLSCAHVALAAMSRLEEARRVALDLMSKVGASPDSVRSVRSARAGEGYERFLQWRARYFLPAGAPWFQRAQVLADAGHRQEALNALGRSVAAREPLAVKIASTPSFAILRSSARYRDLAKQVGVQF
jgi:DNA-binding winged helix-turn-helix (wHTH) protein/tetratricopeptide (TPR) repeat protein